MANEFKIDFIGIGGPKCATTWISQCLMEHPNICFPKNIKEMHFFNEKHIAYGDKVPNRAYEIKGMKWFKSRFDYCSMNSKKGEFSVSYLSDPVACERIKKNFPNVKIIAAVRNPINRIYSGYLHGKRYGDYRKSFEETIFEEDKYLLEKGLFGKYLPMWIENFKNVKIIFYDDVKSNPEKVMKELYEFIGVKSDFKPESLLSKKVNKGGVARFLWLNRAITRTNHYVRKYNFDFIYKFVTLTRLDIFLEKVRHANIKIEKPAEMNPETRKKLIDFYKDDIKKLEKITGRNLDSWLKN